jgi:hypothetical protein
MKAHTPMQLAIACLLAGILPTALPGGTPTATPTQDFPRSVYQWLRLQQAPSGLLGNQEDDDFSGMYSVALAAIAFIHQGDIELAERAFDTYIKHGDAERFDGFNQFWSAAGSTPHRHTDRWAGDNAWLLIALNYHRQATGSSKYNALREALARWLIGLQQEDGGIASGFTAAGPIGHQSTEANLDAYAALIDYPVERAGVLRFLTERMWIPGEDRFRMGSTVEESAMDGGSWAVCSLGDRFRPVLDYTIRAFARTDTMEASGREVAGFGDFLDRKRVWFEGTGQMVVALQVAGRSEEAAHYLAELEKALLPSDRFPGTFGLPCSSSDPAWTGASTRIFVPSQCWYLFGRWGFNPMAP